MTYAVEIKGTANRWIVPGSNQHKILSHCRDKGLAESEAARLYAMHQGFHWDTMFDFMMVYELADSKGHRYVNMCNDRGRAVADLLDSGLAVNLKNMKTDKKRAEKQAEKTVMQQIRATFGSHKYAILRHLFDNGATLSSDVLAEIGYSQIDHSKYAKNLADNGLITLVSSGRSYMLELTELGRKEYGAERLLEPARYTQIARERTTQAVDDLKKAMGDRRSTYGNPANDALHAAVRLFDTMTQNEGWYSEYEGVPAMIESARQFARDSAGKLSEMVEQYADCSDLKESSRAYYQNDIGKSIAKLKEYNIELKLSKNTQAMLISAKLA